MSDILIDPCARYVAARAVASWHYAAGLPTGQIDCYAVREDRILIGAIVFSRGANPNIGRPFGLPQAQVREVARVALGPHASPTSKIVARACRIYRAAHPEVRVLVSYADPSHGHVGVLYQAMGWTYLGRVRGISGAHLRTPTGLIHKRTASHQGLVMTRGVLRRLVTGARKHRFARALDPALQPVLDRLARPYQRRQHRGDAPTIPVGEGGSTPTPALHPTQGNRPAPSRVSPLPGQVPPLRTVAV